MKIIKCHIQNFGKLHDQSFDFKDGLNVISRENGFGKSTLATFIKVMFYGFEGDRRKASYGERKRYKPWQQGTYGGSIRFSVGDREYSLARIFGDKESEDSFDLRDARTNLESLDYTKNIGEELFKIDVDSFKKTVFISQNEVVTSTTDSISAKMGNLSAMTDDISNFEKADKKMKGILNSLNPKRATGELNNIRSRLIELQGSIDGEEILAGSIKEVEEKRLEQIKILADAEEEKKQALEVQKKLSREKDIKVMVERYKGLELQANNSLENTSRYKLSDEEWDKFGKINEMFAKGIPDKDGIEYISSEIALMREAYYLKKDKEPSASDMKLLRSHKAFFEGKDISGEEIDETIELCEEVSKRKEAYKQKRKIHDVYRTEREAAANSIGPWIISLLFLGIALAAGGVIFISKNPALSYGLFGAAVVILLVYLVLAFVRASKRKALKAGPTDEMKALEDEMDEDTLFIEQSEEKINAVLLKVGAGDSSEPLRALNSVLNRMQERKELEKKLKEFENMRLDDTINEHRAAVEDFVSTFGYDNEETDVDEELISLYEKELREIEAGIDTLSGLKEKRDMYNEAVEVSKQHKKEADNYLEENPEVREYVISNSEKSGNTVSLEDEVGNPANESGLFDIAETIKELIEKQDEARKYIADYDRQLEELYEKLDELEKDKEEAEALKESYKEKLKYYNLVKKTEELLTESKEKYTTRYMTPLLHAFTDYYRKVAHSSASEYNIDANMKLTVNAYGGQHDTELLSRGYQDLVGICFRMAMIEAMYKEEKPFVIFDDPFTELDDMKLRGGLGFLKDISSDYQIIYFTCHNSRA